MKDIFRLTKLEFEKIWYNKICIVSFSIIILFGIIFIMLNNGVKSYTKSLEDNSIIWQDKIRNDNAMLNSFKNIDDEYNKILGNESIDAQISINEYRLSSYIIL